MTQKRLEDISVNGLKNLIRENAANKIFLVTGKSSYGHSGAKEFIESAIAGLEWVRFFDFEQNPKFEDALRGTLIFRESNCDMIIAIGGGSVIDMAKLINTFAANPEIDALSIVKNSNNILNKGKKLIAIPTTAGTGSEATHFAVVYHQNKKYSVAHEFILPDVVGLNHKFTLSQPSYLTACAGLDAFSQAMESYWSVGSTQQSKEFAKEALSLLLKHLSSAANSQDEASRKAVLKASYLAGKAINISKTTAAHAVSYAFTTYYSIPHGHAVFLTLPEFFEFNYGVTENDVNDTRGVSYIKNNIDELCHILGVRSPAEGKSVLRDLAKSMGVSLRFEALGIDRCEERIANNVNLERLKNNPRAITKKGLVQLLRSKSI